MFIHYNNGEEEKLIKNVLGVNIIDGEHPAYVTLTDGKELRIRLDRIETICDDGVLENESKTIRGEWLLEREPDGIPFCYHCSVCDKDFHYIGIRTQYEYCPNCGQAIDWRDFK